MPPQYLCCSHLCDTLPSMHIPLPPSLKPLSKPCRMPPPSRDIDLLGHRLYSLWVVCPPALPSSWAGFFLPNPDICVLGLAFWERSHTCVSSAKARMALQKQKMFGQHSVTRFWRQKNGSTESNLPRQILSHGQHSARKRFLSLRLPSGGWEGPESSLPVEDHPTSTGGGRGGLWRQYAHLSE